MSRSSYSRRERSQLLHIGSHMKPSCFYSAAQSGTYHTARSTLAAIYASPLHRNDVAMKLGEPKHTQWASFSVVRRQGSALNAFPQVVKDFTRSNHRTNVANDAVTKCYDAATWPKHWSAGDIEHFLRDKIASGVAAPNYNSFALLLKMNDINSLNTLLRECVVPSETQFHHSLNECGATIVAKRDCSTLLLLAHVQRQTTSYIPTTRQSDTSDFLTQRLAKHITSAADSLQLRKDALSLLESGLSVGCSERRVVILEFPNGKGKLQFITWFVSTERTDAAKNGRVIYWCCGRNQPSLLDLLMVDSTSCVSLATGSNASHDALCFLVRTHVESVTGVPQDPLKYCDPSTAYATWMSETARRFSIPAEGKDNMDPLIFLDSSELLAAHDHKFLVHNCSGKPYTLLEAFCLAVPPTHRIVVTGCDVPFDATDPTYLGKANVTSIAPLE